MRGEEHHRSGVHASGGHTVTTCMLQLTTWTLVPVFFSRKHFLQKREYQELHSPASWWAQPVNLLSPCTDGGIEPVSKYTVYKSPYRGDLEKWSALTCINPYSNPVTLKEKKQPRHIQSMVVNLLCYKSLHSRKESNGARMGKNKKG